jgi:hypothetical protein
MFLIDIISLLLNAMNYNTVLMRYDLTCIEFVIKIAKSTLFRFLGEVLLLMTDEPAPHKPAGAVLRLKPRQLVNFSCFLKYIEYIDSI